MKYTDRDESARTSEIRQGVADRSLCPALAAAVPATGDGFPCLLGHGRVHGWHWRAAVLCLCGLVRVRAQPVPNDLPAAVCTQNFRASGRVADAFYTTGRGAAAIRFIHGAIALGCLVDTSAQ